MRASRPTKWGFASSCWYVLRMVYLPLNGSTIAYEKPATNYIANIECDIRYDFLSMISKLDLIVIRTALEGELSSRSAHTGTWILRTRFTVT